MRSVLLPAVRERLQKRSSAKQAELFKTISGAELIEEGVNGAVVDALDLPGWVSAMRRLSNSRDAERYRDERAVEERLRHQRRVGSWVVGERHGHRGHDFEALERLARTLAPSLARVEWEHIQRVLRDCRGNVSKAARALGLHRRTLQRKLGALPPRR